MGFLNLKKELKKSEDIGAWRGGITVVYIPSWLMNWVGYNFF